LQIITGIEHSPTAHGNSIKTRVKRQIPHQSLHATNENQDFMLEIKSFLAHIQNGRKSSGDKNFLKTKCKTSGTDLFV